MSETYTLTRRVFTAVATVAVALTLSAAAYLTTTGTDQGFDAHGDGQTLAGRKLKSHGK